MPNPDYLKCDCRHCAGSIEFPAEGIGQAITCPHCGQTTELSGPAIEPVKTSRRLPVMGIVAVLVAALAGVAMIVFLKKPPAVPVPEKIVSATTNPPVATPPEETTTNSFVISAIKLEKVPGGSLVYATGKIRNMSDKQRYGVKLELGLYDANDQPVGKATDFHQILEPHGNWNFKALVLDSKAVSARLNAIRED